MAFLVRHFITSDLKYVRQMKSTYTQSLIFMKTKREFHQSAVYQTDKDVLLQLIKQEKSSSELIKVPKRKPYMKNLLLSTLDKELIVYPQVLDKQRYAFLDELCEAVEAYFKNEVDGKLIDQTGEVCDTVMKDVKALGLFGLIIPHAYGGLGFSQTEFCKVAEAFAVNPSISLTLIAHQCLAARAIMEYGTEEQKDKYLPLMATGEKIGSFCFSEESGGSDPGSLQSKLYIDQVSDTFNLSGIKTWVTNGMIADMFIVIAKEATETVSDEMLTAVIVDRVDGKISVEKQNTLGMRGSYLAKVTFDDVFLTNSDILGPRRGGLQIALDVYNSSRISVAAVCTGISKHLIELCNEHILNRTMYDIKMFELANVREKIVYMTVRTYGMESFTYFVASLEDLYDEQDYVIESASLKVTATDALVENIQSAQKILATRALDDEYPYERFCRDAIALSNFLGSNDVTTLVLALDGLEYCGKNMSTLILKKRQILDNPRFHIRDIVRKFLHLTRNQSMFNMELEYYLHPILQEEAKDLEKIIVYLSYGIEKSLVMFGNKVTSEHHQFITSRIGSCTSIALMLMSAISRASRSSCLGFPQAANETINIRLLFKLYGHVENHHIAEIFSGIDKLDINMLHDISVDIVNDKKYSMKSPIFRYLW